MRYGSKCGFVEMKIDVYQCDHTHKILFGRDEYRVHLRELAAKKIAEKKYVKAKHHLRSLLPELRKCSTFPAIASWIEEHALELREAATDPRHGRRSEEPFSLKSVKFTMTRAEYMSAGWGHDKQDGSGWSGNIQFVMQNGPSFDILRLLPIKTGSGGGNSFTGGYRMEVYFFDEDWPSLAVMHRMEDTAHLVEAY